MLCKPSHRASSILHTIDHSLIFWCTYNLRFMQIFKEHVGYLTWQHEVVDNLHAWLKRNNLFEQKPLFQKILLCTNYNLFTMIKLEKISQRLKKSHCDLWLCDTHSSLFKDRGYEIWILLKMLVLAASGTRLIKPSSVLGTTISGILWVASIQTCASGGGGAAWEVTRTWLGVLEWVGG